MENYHLGPNGSLVLAMEFLEKNLDWLFAEIPKFADHYFIFDMPGQVLPTIICLMSLTLLRCGLG